VRSAYTWAGTNAIRPGVIQRCFRDLHTATQHVFVDPSTLPAPLEAFVNVNPVSILATASRSLMEGEPDGAAILISLAVAAALAAVFLPITTRLYRSR